MLQFVPRSAVFSHRMALYGVRQLLLLLVAPFQLLLQHNAVNARFEQCEHQARLALEVAKTI